MVFYSLIIALVYGGSETMLFLVRCLVIPLQVPLKLSVFIPSKKQASKNIYLLIRKSAREVERGLSSQLAVMPGAEPGWSQEPGTPSWSST